MSDSDKKSRRAYRGSVTKLIHKAEEELYKHPEERDTHRLKALITKQQVLRQLDDLIWKEVADESAEEELEQVDDYNENIAICLLDLEKALKPPTLSVTPAILPNTPVIEPEATLTNTSAIEPEATPTSHSTASTGLDDGDRSHTMSAEDTMSADTPRIRTTVETSPVRICTPPARTDTPHSDSTPRETREASRVKLPRLTIPTFNGNIAQWRPFWDQFESTIHDNGQLRDVDKFKYLISYLEGEAKEAIAGIAVTSANYCRALNRLQERFGDI